MTIAAGFTCDDGVLICADTLLSANFRQQGPKVFSWRDDQVAVVVSGAGSYVLLRLAKEAIFRKLEGFRDAKKSFNIKHDVIEPVLASLYDDHIDKAPDREWSNGYGLNLLVGAWHRGSNAVLYESDRRACAVVDGFSCLGSGAPVANYIASTLLSTTLPVMWGRIIAAYLIQQSKAYGEDCGGDTNIAILQNNGKLINVNKSALQAAELAANRIHEALGVVLFTATRQKGHDKYGKAFRVFRNAVKRTSSMVRLRHLAIDSGFHERICDIVARQEKEDRLTRRSPNRGPSKPLSHE